MGYNLSQISPEIAPAPSPAPVALEPPPAPEPTYAPPAPVEGSGMGLGGAILGGVLIAGGVVALAVAASGMGEKTPSTTTTTSTTTTSSSICSQVTYSSCCSSSSTVSCYLPSSYYNSCGCPSGTRYGGVTGQYYICSCRGKVGGIGKVPVNLNYNAFKMPGSGLTLLNSNLSSSVDLFKTKFEILGACSGNDSMLTTSLGLQVKGEYSRQRG